MSLLSALLTQDLVVSPKAIDEAISRQVLNGGDFETSLLEGGAIGEDTLARYCAAVHGLPHATREDVASADPVATARLPRDLAERHGMAALFIEAGRLIVAVTAPIAPIVRVQVEDLVRLPLEGRCVTSVRLAWALWRYYQVPLSPRLERIAARLQTTPPGPVPAEVMIPLTRPRAGSRPSAVSTPASDALATFSAVMDEVDAQSNSSNPPPSEPAPPPGLRRSSPDLPPLRVEPRAHNPMAVNLPTTTPPFGMFAVRPSNVPEPRVSPPPPVPSAPEPPPPVAAPAAPVVARAAPSPPPPTSPLSDPPPATRPAILPSPSLAARAPVAPQRATEAQEAVKPPAPTVVTISAPPPTDDPPRASMPSSLPPTPLLPSAPKLPLGMMASMPPPAIEVLLQGDDGVFHDVHLSSLPPPPRGLTLDEALRRIDAARDRDAIVDAMLAHVYERFVYVALLVVQGGQCGGVSGCGEGALGGTLRAVSFSLERPSIFRLAHESGAVEVARVEPDTLDAEVRAQLNRSVAEEVVVAPIRLGAKVALLLWADNGRRAPTALAVRDLDAFIKRCAAAFERLIATRKRTGRGSQPQITLPAARTVDRAPLPDRSARLHALQSALHSDAPPATPSAAPGLWSDPPESVDVEVGRAEPHVGLKATPVRAPGDVCAAIVRELIEGGAPVPGALDTLIAHGEAGMEAVFARFPGPHRARRAEGGAKLPSLDEGAPLLRAAVAFRHAAAPRLVRALDDADPDTRYCAALCLSECVHASAVAPLVGRLFDEDDAVRAAAVEALRTHQRFAEFDDASRTIRAALGERGASFRKAAAVALGELRDAEAVPALVAGLDDPDPAVAEATHKALATITRQDFGAMAAPWVAWWARAGQQHRVEWLIDALLHPEPGVRHEASEELKKLTGQYFGYYFNLPKRDRERAHQRYVEWWKSDGAQRFDGRDA
jgi:hypothetical protein